LNIIKKAKCTGKVERKPWYFFFRDAELHFHNYKKSELCNYGVCQNCYTYIGYNYKGNYKYVNKKIQKVEIDAATRQKLNLKFKKSEENRASQLKNKKN
jgi:hypothetical protein